MGTLVIILAGIWAVQSVVKAYIERNKPEDPVYLDGDDLEDFEDEDEEDDEVISSGGSEEENR